MSSELCPNKGWENGASEFYRCTSCGYKAHWQDLRPHALAETAEQERQEAALKPGDEARLASYREMDARIAAGKEQEIR